MARLLQSAVRQTYILAVEPNIQQYHCVIECILIDTVFYFTTLHC